MIDFIANLIQLFIFLFFAAMWVCGLLMLGGVGLLIFMLGVSLREKAQK